MRFVRLVLLIAGGLVFGAFCFFRIWLDGVVLVVRIYYYGVCFVCLGCFVVMNYCVACVCCIIGAVGGFV